MASRKCLGFCPYAYDRETMKILRRWVLEGHSMVAYTKLELDYSHFPFRQMNKVISGLHCRDEAPAENDKLVCAYRASDYADLRPNRQPQPQAKPDAETHDGDRTDPSSWLQFG